MKHSLSIKMVLNLKQFCEMAPCWRDFTVVRCQLDLLISFCFLLVASKLKTAKNRKKCINYCHLKTFRVSRNLLSWEWCSRPSRQLGKHFSPHSKGQSSWDLIKSFPNDSECIFLLTHFKVALYRIQVWCRKLKKWGIVSSVECEGAGRWP